MHAFPSLDVVPSSVGIVDPGIAMGDVITQNIVHQIIGVKAMGRYLLQHGAEKARSILESLLEIDGQSLLQQVSGVVLVLPDLDGLMAVDFEKFNVPGGSLDLDDINPAIMGGTGRQILDHV